MNKKTLKAGALVLVAAAAHVLITGSINAQAKKPGAAAPATAPAVAKPTAGKPEAAKAEPIKNEPAKAEPVKTEAAKPEPAKTEAAPVPTAQPTKAEPTEDPSLTNDKDMLPNGHYSHRVAHPKDEKLTLIGRLQMRAMSGQRDTMYSVPGTDFALADFNFRRLRLGAMYQGDHHWGMIINLRLENAMNKASVNTATCATPTGGTTTCATGINDARGFIHEANIWYNFDFLRTRIIFGMQNVPFTREYIQSSANLINIERSLGTNGHNQFDNGLAVMFNPLKAVDKSLDRYLTVWGMIGTGHGGNGDFGYGRRVDNQYAPTASTYDASLGGNGNVSPAPAFYGRIQYNALGGLSRGKREVGWQDGEEIFQKDLKLSFGAALMGSSVWKINIPMPVEYVPRNQNAATGVATDNIAGWNTSTATSVGGGLMAQTYDAVATWRGIYAMGAYMYYGGSAGNNISSYNMTLGYNIPLTASVYVMPVVRYDYMQGNFASSTASTNNTNTWHQNVGPYASNPANQMGIWYVGVNLFGDKHLFKLQLFYAIFNNDLKGYDTAGNALGGYAMNTITFQAQGTFWTGSDIANKPSHTDL